MDNTDLLLTADECAAFLKVSKVTLYRHIAAGTFPKPVKVGALSRWPRSELLAVLETAKAARSAIA